MRSRRLVGLVVTAALGVGILAGCTDTRTQQFRPFPQGDTAATSQQVDSELAPRSPRDLRPIDPDRLFVPSLDVSAPVMSLGTVTETDSFLGGARVSSFEVPPDLVRVGWWRDGPPVGGAAMAVILGHSQVGGGYAAFTRLGELRAGDEVIVEDTRRRAQLTYAVTKVVTGLSKTDRTALGQALAANAPTQQLALVTCSGDFDDDYRESVDNTVAFARRI